MIVMSVALLFAMLASWWRPTFFALLTSACYLSWYWFFRDLHHDLHPFIFFIMILTTLILDLSWLSTCTARLWRTTWVDSASQSGLRTFTVLISYLLFVAEFVGTFLSASITYSFLTSARTEQQPQLTN